MYVFESVIAPHSHTHDSVDSRLTARTWSSSNRVVARLARYSSTKKGGAGYREMSTAAVRRERRPSRRASSRASSAMRSKSAAVGAPSTTPGGDAGAAESELRSKRAASTSSSPGREGLHFLRAPWSPLQLVHGPAWKSGSTHPGEPHWPAMVQMSAPAGSMPTACRFLCGMTRRQSTPSSSHLNQSTHSLLSGHAS